MCPWVVDFSIQIDVLLRLLGLLLANMDQLLLAVKMLLYSSARPAETHRL